jgi:ERCC4-type nuclease
MDNNDNKENFLDWMKKVSKDEIKTSFMEWLIARQEDKRLVYSLGQVELRSLKMPGINYLNNLFGNYYEECKGLQFINKYEDFNKWGKQIELDKRRVIYCDSREQNTLCFKNTKSLRKKLDFGDYAFSDALWSGNVVIERKSLNDLIGTLFSGYDRFIREIERAKNDDACLVILVECNLSDSIDYRNRKTLNYHITIPPEVIFHKVRNLIQQYSHIQFLFVHSHNKAAEIVEKLFSLGSQIKKYDLQLLYDLNKI